MPQNSVTLSSSPPRSQHPLHPPARPRIRVIFLTTRYKANAHPLPLVNTARNTMRILCFANVHFCNFKLRSMCFFSNFRLAFGFIRLFYYRKEAWLLYSCLRKDTCIYLYSSWRSIAFDLLSFRWRLAVINLKKLALFIFSDASINPFRRSSP